MDSALIDETCEEFLGQWKRLVSTTNWDKGRIIFQWRQALADRSAPSSEYSDDAWSQRVGNVTPQHVGRLRRVFERFAESRDEYRGLYWSHFQAALDWNDAEMWLEGAVQNEWSISQMRQCRWEALGAPDELKPRPEDVLEGPWDDDAEVEPQSNGRPGALEESIGIVRHADQESRSDGAGYADEPDVDEFEEEFGHDAEPSRAARASGGANAISPFAQLPPLPDDVNEAFESFKLCIVRHRLARFDEISRDDLLASLDALKELVLAPLEAESV